MAVALGKPVISFSPKMDKRNQDTKTQRHKDTKKEPVMSAFAGGKAAAQLKEDDVRKVLAERLKGLDETLVEYCASMLMEEDFRVDAGTGKLRDNGVVLETIVSCSPVH